MRTLDRIVVSGLGVWALTACGGGEVDASEPQTELAPEVESIFEKFTLPRPTNMPEVEPVPLVTPEAEPAPIETWGTDPLVLRVSEPFSGDLAAMREREVVRVLVSYSRTGFFIADGQLRGFEVEMFRELEKELAAKTPKGTPPLRFALPKARTRVPPSDLRTRLPH